MFIQCMRLVELETSEPWSDPAAAVVILDYYKCAENSDDDDHYLFANHSDATLLPTLLIKKGG